MERVRGREPALERVESGNDMRAATSISRSSTTAGRAAAALRARPFSGSRRSGDLALLLICP